MSKKYSNVLTVCITMVFVHFNLNAQTVNQSDTFQGGTTLSWTSGASNPTQPGIITTGGPAGLNDQYLHVVSAGGSGAGSKLVFFNKAQWTGNYLTAGITQISMQLKNEGPNALLIRIALSGSTGNCISSAVALPVGSGWVSTVFPLAQNMMTVSGTYATIMGSVTEIRILHSSSASTQGEAIVAQLGVDNITALGSTPQNPTDSIPPSAPQNVVVIDSSSNTLSLRWSKNNEADFLRYRIYRNISPNPITQVDSTIGGIIDTTKIFSGLPNGTRFYLRLTAVDSTGNESSFSNEVSATPRSVVIISFSAKTFLFGGVKIGQFKDTVITISNTGNDTLRISNISSADTIFSSKTKQLNIAPGSNAKDTLRFKPAVLNAISGKLILQSNSQTSPDTIFVSGTGLPTTGVDYSQSIIPKKYYLEQNYPNPFNPGTMINYQLPMNGYVTLKVYDVLGREAASLVNEIKEAGSYSAKFDGSQLSSGIYFYTLQSGNFTATKKLTLMK